MVEAAALLGLHGGETDAFRRCSEDGVGVAGPGSGVTQALAAQRALDRRPDGNDVWVAGLDLSLDQKMRYIVDALHEESDEAFLDRFHQRLIPAADLAVRGLHVHPHDGEKSPAVVRDRIRRPEPVFKEQRSPDIDNRLVGR